MSAGEKVRLFAALELPAAVRSALPVPGEGWRAIAPEMQHVTLAFLGWRIVDDVKTVTEAMAGAVVPVGSLSLGKIVLLPPRGPRVMAVSLVDDENGSLRRLHAGVSAALVSAGVYVAERRPFLPHVTIGRSRERMRRGAPVPSVPELSFTPSSVALFRSQLGGSGARYSVLERFPLS